MTDLLIQNRNITIYYNRNDSVLCPYQMLDILKELQKNKLNQQELQKLFLVRILISNKDKLGVLWRERVYTDIDKIELDKSQFENLLEVMESYDLIAYNEQKWFLTDLGNSQRKEAIQFLFEKGGIS